MRITDLEAIPYALRFRKPYVTAAGTLERREMILVRVHTDEGLVGLGEAVPLSLRGGASLERVWGQLRRAAHRIAGTDLGGLAGDEPLAAAIDVIVRQLPGRRYAPPAKAALEMALFDLASRVADQPLWRLLRADSAAPIHCNATLVAGEPRDVAEQARSWSAEGFRTFKLKLGVGDDLEQVAAVRGELGPAARIRVDANGSWRVDDAIAILAQLAAHDLELAEEPVSGLRSLARVTAASPVALAADESVNDAADATKAARAGACRYATVKLAKVGGMGPATAIAQELPVYLSSALDGPVGIAAAGHLAQALYRDRVNPGLDHGLATQLLFSDRIASAECRVGEGDLHLPDGPGLGVELDEAALERARL